jgi:TonB family protein
MLSACSGSRGFGGCQLPGTLPQLAGTPIPTQPIPSGANVAGTFTVFIDAVVNQNGNVTSEKIATSSGNMVIDSAALSLVSRSSSG